MATTLMPWPSTLKIWEVFCLCNYFLSKSILTGYALAVLLLLILISILVKVTYLPTLIIQIFTSTCSHYDSRFLFTNLYQLIGQGKPYLSI